MSHDCKRPLMIMHSDSSATYLICKENLKRISGDSVVYYNNEDRSSGIRNQWLPVVEIIISPYVCDA